MKKLYYGVAYYDEYMPCDRLEKDIQMMQEAGINLVRIAESTWSTLEPRPGVFDFSHIDRALEDLDRWIGWIGSALEEAGILEETNLFLVSDHGQQNVCRNISLNVLFAENGLIRLDFAPLWFFTGLLFERISLWETRAGRR